MLVMVFKLLWKSGTDVGLSGIRKARRTMVPGSKPGADVVSIPTAERRP
jgi:hypothetical protein